MVFNGDTNGQDLCTLADLMVGTDDIDFPLTEKALYANWGQREIRATIYMAYGGWIDDDRNNTTLPESTGNLTTSPFYALPDDVQSLDAVEWMDASGNWHATKPITLEAIEAQGYAESQFMTTAGDPIYYRPIANGFKLYPASSAARASAIRFKGARDIVVFTSTTTNTAPGFDSLLHEKLAIFMALTYAKFNDMSVAGGTMRGGFKTGLLADWGEALADVNNHYSMKAKQLFPQTVKHRKDFVDQYVS